MINSNSESEKSYDRLYKASQNGILWKDEPGRLIKNIKKYIDKGRVLDAGCGDGKNALFLEQNGFSVVGIDNSAIAIEGLRSRFLKAGWEPRGAYSVMDVREISLEMEFDVLVSYGLFHCLPTTDRINVHKHLQEFVKPDGFILFSCLVRGIELPINHGTIGIELVSPNEIEKLFISWKILYQQIGIIDEEHPPLVALHKHSVAWIIAKRQSV